MPREDTQFQKGTSGNPAGKPKGLPSKKLMDEQLRALAIVKKDGKTYAELAAEFIWEKAISAKSFTERRWALEMVFNRIDGRPLQQVQTDVQEDVRIIQVPDTGLPETLKVVPKVG